MLSLEAKDSQRWLQVFNGATYYFVWYITIYSTAKGYPYVGPPLIAAILLFQLFFLKDRWRHLLVLISISCGGTLLDSILLNTRVVIYQGGYAALPWLAPLWITGMWAMFASSLDLSFAFLQNRSTVSAILGFTVVPFYYFAIAKTGVISLERDPIYSYIFIGLIWAAAMPLSFYLARKILRQR